VSAENRTKIVVRDHSAICAPDKRNVVQTVFRNGEREFQTVRRRCGNLRIKRDRNMILGHEWRPVAPLNGMASLATRSADETGSKSSGWRRAQGEKAFWIFQLFGWSGLTIINYLSLTLWYNPIAIQYFAAPVMQAVAGMLLSLPLRFTGRAVWNASIPVRIVVNGAAILVVAVAWTIARIAIFQVMTGDQIAPAEYGGWLHASIIVFVAWALSYHAVKLFRSVHEQRELTLIAEAMALEERAKRLEAEGLSRDAQLRMLRYQINPHFLFNTLNSISALIRLRRNDDARAMLSKMSDFMRVSLHANLTSEVTFAEEFENAGYYIDVEKTRFGDRVILAFDIDPQAKTAVVPNMVLQPIYENAFKYAVGETLRSVTISLSAHVEGDVLRIAVADDGPGLRRASRIQNSTSTGIGLENISQRLKALYGERGVIRVDERPSGGVIVAMTLPFRHRPQTPANP
jgi:two-component system, LytTR family, sensor kinase